MEDDFAAVVMLPVVLLLSVGLPACGGATSELALTASVPIELTMIESVEKSRSKTPRGAAEASIVLVTVP
jgi:multisubunit Na+/H+ antiporter MnhB subunit